MDDAEKEIGRLNQTERRLIRMLRELDYGELRIMVRDGKPVRAVEIKSIFLEQKDE
jgi:hypothetical protein